MHEAGIAVAVAAAIADRGLDPSRVRLIVSGGHGDEASFDAALRAHLEAQAPGRGLGALEILHAPVPRLCASCATPFEAAYAADPCPACGGPGIALPAPESIELELLDGDDTPLEVHEAPHDPAEHDHPHEHPHGHAHPHDHGPDRPRAGDSRHSSGGGPGGTLRP